ncbi:hypothetical protein IW146_006229 [Coemansia sp. RSA 922]|nr:hypothetical protein IW146_006229 [Coemansia sp. RSA 922]
MHQIRSIQPDAVVGVPVGAPEELGAAAGASAAERRDVAVGALAAERRGVAAEQQGVAEEAVVGEPLVAEDEEPDVVAVVAWPEQAVAEA